MINQAMGCAKQAKLDWDLINTCYAHGATSGEGFGLLVDAGKRTGAHTSVPWVRVNGVYSNAASNNGALMQVVCGAFTDATRPAACGKPPRTQTLAVSGAFLASQQGAAAAAATHYEDPSAGPCQAGELAVQIEGVKGGFCSPSCSAGPCPTDVPAGTNASPECALETQGASRPSRCALICQSSSKCPAKASCKLVQGAIGLCTYDS